MAEEEKEKSKKVEVKAFSLVEVPTQTTIVFQDEKGNVFDQNQALVNILNDLALIKKGLL